VCGGEEIFVGLREDGSFHPLVPGAGAARIWMGAFEAGENPEKMIAALSSGLVQSRVLELRGLNLVKGEYPPGFRIRLHRKDLRLAMEAGVELGVTIPATGQLYQRFTVLLRLIVESWIIVV